MRRDPARLPGLAPALRHRLRPGCWTARSRSAPCAPASRRTSPLGQRHPPAETGHPGRLERPLLASLRDDRADHRPPLRQRRRRRRRRPRLPVHPLEAAARPGDIVYLPLEEAQYVRRRATSDLGPDAAIMLRHDRATLSDAAAAPPDRRPVCLRPARRRHEPDRNRAGPAAASTILAPPPTAATTNGATTSAIPPPTRRVNRVRTRRDRSPFIPTAAQITAGYGTALVVAFLDWADGAWRARDRRPARRLHRLAHQRRRAGRRSGALFRDHGADFLELPDARPLSRAPHSSTRRTI